MANSHGRSFPWTCPRCGSVTVTRLEGDRDADLTCSACREPFPEKCAAELPEGFGAVKPQRDEKRVR